MNIEGLFMTFTSHLVYNQISLNLPIMIAIFLHLPMDDSHLGYIKNPRVEIGGGGR
jgi:hypothetical protein